MKKYSAEPIEVFCHTAEEAVRYLQKLFPELTKLPIDKRAVVQIAGFHTEQSLKTPTDSEDFHILPAFFGAGGKGGGFFQIIIGAVLIVASFYMPASLAFLSNAMFSMGASMVLGGLLSLMAPAPDRGDQNRQQQASDPEGSKYLAANGNTTAHGTRIPIVYGKHKVYGHYLSFNVDTKDVAVDAG